ncbi:hypothetical protein D5S17_11680 [Pseudonocardiaceae bacterium YIM PH 21723]|nr:hypothetical protein D5S17_11680 [Pseudonocardiaceae bacterium YIM PH 21723]
MIGWPPFDEAFHLSCADPSFAKAIITPEVAQWLLGDPRAGVFPLYIEGTALSTWMVQDLLTVMNFRPLELSIVNPMADYLARFHAALPRN